MLIFDSSTPEYNLGSVAVDIANNRLFKPPRNKKSDQLFKLQYANKGIDAVNISDILYHEKVHPCTMYITIFSVEDDSFYYFSIIHRPLLLNLFTNRKIQKASTSSIRKVVFQRLIVLHPSTIALLGKSLLVM